MIRRRALRFLGLLTVLTSASLVAAAVAATTHVGPRQQQLTAAVSHPCRSVKHCPSPSPSPSPSLSPSPTATPTPTRKPPVVVILMENHEYGSVVGSASAPYLNGTLIPSGRLFTNYYAVSHPSLPNYLALTVGDTCGKDGSDTVRPLCTQPSIWGQMSAAGITAREWAENESANCSYASDGTGRYAERHDSYAIVTDAESLTQCGDRTTGTGTAAPGVAPLATALTSTQPPAYSFVTPNLCDDMHDCSVSAGDSWLAANVPLLLHAGAIVIVTFDEGTTSTNGGGHVMAVEAGPGIPAGGQDGTLYTHYSLLAGIENYFSLPLLANARTAAKLPV
jgi:phosphatidylinositol-3-phosphatase